MSQDMIWEGGPVTPETDVTPSVTASIIVPWRSTPQRAPAWAWLKAYYWDLFPGGIIQGDDPSRFPFSKPAAVNRAVQQTDADVLVIMDADVYLKHEHVLEAVRLVGSGEATWMTPIDKVHRLDEARSQKLLSYDPRDLPWPEERGRGQVMRPWKHAAMIIVVRRSDYVAVGGMDERYEGHGSDDVELHSSLTCLVGEQHPPFEDSVGFHLWDSTPRKNGKVVFEGQEKDTNMSLTWRYINARKAWLDKGNKEPALKLLAERLGGHGLTDVQVEQETVTETIVSEGTVTEPDASFTIEDPTAEESKQTPAVSDLRNIITVDINLPIPHPDNPRRGDVNAIARSLEKFGQVSPIVVQRSTSYVVKGNHTLQAAKRLGWRTIRVLVLDMDDKTARAYLLADNITSDKASNDKSKLYELESELLEQLEGLISPDEVEELGASIGITEEWDGDPEYELDENITEVEAKYDPLRELMIAIPTSEMEAFTDQIARLQQHWNTKTTTDTVRRVVNIAYEALPEPEEGFKQGPASTGF